MSSFINPGRYILGCLILGSCSLSCCSTAGFDGFVLTGCVVTNLSLGFGFVIGFVDINLFLELDGFV